MNSPFSTLFARHCEAAALSFDVPALAAGISIGGAVETAAVGCEPETLFRIASITKPLTATLVLGLVDLEEPTGVWPGEVRIRHLLSHTSGFDSECGDLARFGDGDDALAVLCAELPAVRRFLGVEEVWSYANTGYWLAGHLAAQRAGSSYEDALEERVLRPAGLESTSFAEPELTGTGPDAVAGPYPRARRPSGGLVSNVPDLLRFGRWHLVRPESAQLRIAHGVPVDGVYGLGLRGQQVAGTEVWGHGGSYGGFQSSLVVIPGRDAVFAGLTNSGRGGQALRLLEDAFFEHVLGARRTVPGSVPLAAHVLDAFAGTYENSDGRYQVARAADGLAVIFPEGAYRARPIGERTFEIVDGDRAGDRLDFPRERFGRFGSRLAERVG
ncbi:MAG TPA: serine hydrolase domain-containing protein [Gaiellaceae bacterium]|nr:serine hydrolase domain-containing protein [Gaiellaceae bacterium]